MSASEAYRSNVLNEARDVVAHDLGDIPLISVDDFLRYALPPEDEDVLARIKTQLLKKGYIKKNRWRDFSKAPKATKQKELNAFKGLKKIFNHVVSAASEVKGCNAVLDFEYHPNQSLASERVNSSRPDAYLELKEKKSKTIEPSPGQTDLHHWEDIVLSCEFKLDPANSHDNYRKVVWSAHHVMRTDPCRRFTFGITAENDQMRLWFFTRSIVIVTYPFDFVTELDTIIRVFTSLAFADTDILGFDPTVTRDVVENKIQYKYVVGGETYVTISPLADHSADFTRGRGTRVSKASLESDSKTVVVLKDVWLEDDRTEEGSILQGLQAAVDKKLAEGKVFPQGDPLKYFLTVRAHGRVKVNGVEDHTLKVMMRGFRLAEDVEYLKTSAPKPRMSRSSRGRHDRSSAVGHTPVVTSEVAAQVQAELPPPRRFQGRFHYRIVFNEIGKTMHELHNLSDVFLCLAGATIGLEILHIIGYVHRDISVGNVLFCDGTGKLSDLESAKQPLDLTTHDVRTGTNQFEAIEIAMKGYFFRPQTSRTPDPDFKFNCIHDLESTWWIAAWILFHHVPQNEQHLGAQILHAAELFPSVGVSTHRARFFTQPGNVVKRFADLPPSFVKFQTAILDARDALYNAFVAAERGSEIDDTAFDGLHQTLATIWLNQVEQARNISYSYILPANHRGTQDHPQPPDEPDEPRTGTVRKLVDTAKHLTGRYDTHSTKRLRGG